MKDVDFPLDDYFMALAILATTRSGSPDPVWHTMRSFTCVVLPHLKSSANVCSHRLVLA